MVGKWVWFRPRRKAPDASVEESHHVENRLPKKAEPPQTPRRHHARFLKPHRPSLYDVAGNFSVRIRERDAQRTARRLLTRDPYHSLLSLPLVAIVLLFVSAHVMAWLVYTPVYMRISRDCGLGAGAFQRALYYSVITMSTIGFGTPDMTFEGCTSALFVIMSQTLLALLLNGILVGMLYTKIARSKQRSVRIVFSEKACIRQIRNRYYFMFQTFDRSSSTSHNQLIEAHVRCFAIKHETVGDEGEPIFFQQCAMRLSHPNDELGSMLMMALPTLVSHRIDPWSPLCPAPHEPPFGYAPTPMNTVQGYPNLVLREDDCESGNRACCVCEVCGETYETRAQLELHRRAAAVDERFSGHDAATICPETGESLPTVASLRTYCAYNNFQPPPGRRTPRDQRGHSRVNHLKYLPAIVAKDDDFRPNAMLHHAHHDEESHHEQSSLLDPLVAPPPASSPLSGGAFPHHQRDADDDGHSSSLDEHIELMAMRGPSEDEETPARLESWRDGRRIQDHMHRTGMEILVYVEAIETYTSSTMQARHSYHFEAGDIEFDKTFVPCVTRNGDGRAEIDMDAFHAVRPAPKNASAFLSTPSMV
ncbi:hypothetical protein CTAYLR_008554 [Chrysophaeum taylorii]|uniref:Uncharacterized protein n=1 Tax=Chrysophaeum taylorii TaxID=2483200 RepID=A0AAD7XK59_9STRA|nr:hypothetical protein CTAYLR_008554 [Chrysophaeum taylorii]